MRSFLVFLSLLTLLGCGITNNRASEFAAIEMGMVKSEVLDVAGPPHWSDRHEGYDRWIYYMEPEARHTERVVYFRNGKVFQKGQRIKPVLTAEEMDEINKPRVKKPKKDFKPSMSEEELRQAIKKEIEKEKKKQPKKKKSSVEVL